MLRYDGMHMGVDIKRAVVLLAAVMALMPAPDCCGASLALGGASRNFFTSDKDRTAFISLLRLRASFEFNEGTGGELAYEVSPRYVSRGETALPEVTASTAYRVADLNPEPVDSGEFIATQNLDRLSVDISTSFCDIHIGRQAVSFGAARVVNPTDIIAPFTYSTIATEERPGVDSLRIRVPTGALGEVDAGAVFGKDMDAQNSAAFLRLRSYVLMTDVIPMAMHFRGNTLFGLSLARSIGGASAWAEAAYVLPEESGEKDYAGASVGADYKFTDKLYSYMEYHHNGAGAESSGGYLSLFDKTAYTEGSVYLLARHYIAPGLSYELTPLTGLSAGLLLNLNDGSAMASPALLVSLADDVTLRLGTFLTFGQEDGSEFGAYQNVFYAGLNAYF